MSRDQSAERKIVVRGTPRLCAAEVEAPLTLCGLNTPVFMPALRIVVLIQRFMVSDEAFLRGEVVVIRRLLQSEAANLNCVRYFKRVTTGHSDSSLIKERKIKGSFLCPGREVLRGSENTKVTSSDVRYMLPSAIFILSNVFTLVPESSISKHTSLQTSESSLSITIDFK